MALTCNSFSDNTIGATQNTSGCVAPHLANLSDHQLNDEQFMLLVLDSLSRLFPGVLADAPACDLADALRNASCVMNFTTPQTGPTVAQQQAQILYLLNEALCAE